MNVVSGHNYALKGYTELGTTWFNEINFGMSHVPPVDTAVHRIEQLLSANFVSDKFETVTPVTYFIRVNLNSICT